MTPAWSRFLVLPRASYARLWKSRFLVMFFMACFFYPLGCAAFIYVSNNLTFLETMNIPAGRLFEIGPVFFQYFCYVQGSFAYLLTAFVGPSVISPDLVNGALPLYLCRPFTRTEYILGKLTVLMVLLSIITWIPGLILFSIQGSLAGWDWTVANWNIAWATFAGLVVWSLVLSLIALALSAWIKWRIAAGALVLGVFFAGAGFGTAINQILRTEYGSLLNLVQVMDTIWSQMFGTDPDLDLSTGSAWMCLGIVAGVSLWLLLRRVRAFEVIK